MKNFSKKKIKNNNNKMRKTGLNNKKTHKIS